MRRMLAVLLLAALPATACTGRSEPVTGPDQEAVGATGGIAGSEPARPPVAGGTVRVRVATEPDGLNPWAAPASDDVAVITRPVLAPLWRIRPDGDFEPWLLAGEPEVVTDDDGTPTVVFEVRDDAFWSDGQPIDGRDVLFTLEACGALPPEQRGGQPCGAVDPAASSADGRQATVGFSRPVGDWRTLLADLPVLPEHLLAGRDIRSAWSARLPVSSGPFRFASWTRGERIVLDRNDRWWGERPALDRIEVVFGESAGVAELVDGTIDVAAVDATLSNLERARATARLRVAVDAGQTIEALDFNVASPRVGRAAVRTALAAVLDVDVMVDEAIRPIVPATRPRHGLLVATAPGTAPTQGPEDSGAGGLRAIGCGTGIDGVAVCDGATMRLRLDLADASWQHRLVAEYVTSQLADVGVEVVPATEAREWDLRVGTVPGDPMAMARRWRCDGPANDQAYCNPALDLLLDRAGRLPPGDERDAVLTEAELMLARDRPTHPLYPMPEMLVYRSAVRGPAINSGSWGPTWNTEEWARTVAAVD